jgi:nucleoside-diphosphate-sugar epimerase
VSDEASAGPAEPARAELCLVTGASGFIGSHLATRLVREGHHVRCLVRASSDSSHLRRLGVELTVGDLTDPASLARAVDGVQLVVHCAALVSDWATVTEIEAINVAGTRSLLEASAGASVRRFVHISSTDVYGFPDARAVAEDHVPRGFSNWYSQSKRRAEAEVRRVAGASALEIVILRPATVYGPGSTDVIGEIARAIRGRHMLLIDRGRPLAGLCYVENLIDAVVLALRQPAAAGETFNVSDGLDVTWRRLTDDLAEGLGCPPARFSLPYRLALGLGVALEHGYRLARRATGLSVPALLSRQAVQVLGRDQDFSNRRLRELLGWKPLVDYDSGLRATLAWLRDEGPKPT